MRRTRRRNKNQKVIFLSTIAFCVVAISVAYAAFSNTLTISANATVTPDESNFKVGFSTESDSITTGTVQPGGGNPDYANKGTTATLTETTVSGITWYFTGPETKSDAYSFYVVNAGQYDATLASVVYENVKGKSSPIVCTALAGTTDSLVQKVCSNISVIVTTRTYNSDMPVIWTTTKTNNAVSIVIPKGHYRTVEIGFQYTGNDLADGPFKVEFGDINFNFTSAT